MQPKVILCKTVQPYYHFQLRFILATDKWNFVCLQESSPAKLAPLPHNITEPRRSRMNSDRHEVNIFFSNIKKNTMFMYIFFLDISHLQDVCSFLVWIAYSSKKVTLSGLSWCAPTVHQRWYGIQEGKTSCSLYHLQMPSPLGSIWGWKNYYFWLHNSHN